jgi:DNA-binding NarL/FixJ family response regulator
MTAATPPFQRHPFAPGSMPGQRGVPGARPAIAPMPGTRMPQRMPIARPLPQQGRPLGAPVGPGLRPPQQRPLGQPQGRPQGPDPRNGDPRNGLSPVQQQAPQQPYAEGTTVLIVDDHRIVREGLRHFVGEVPGVTRVLTAASGEEALARYDAERPDLVLMDIQMPGLGGLEAVRRLVGKHPRAVVVVLTAADDRENVATAVANGARGYLSKDVSHQELCAAVATALAGEDLFEPTMRRAITERVGPRPVDPASELTEREMQVLRGMAAGQSNAEIGRSLFLSEDTIKTHARRLFRKLGVGDRAQAVALGFRRGYVR